MDRRNAKFRRDQVLWSFGIRDLPMTGQELESIRLLLGADGEPLPQYLMGELLCCSERAYRNYVTGRKIPRLVAREARRLKRIREAREKP